MIDGRDNASPGAEGHQQHMVRIPGVSDAQWTGRNADGFAAVIDHLPLL
jgi:hypothetical protein